MTLIDIEQDRQSNPVDTIETMAGLNDWTFERDGDDEITISITAAGRLPRRHHLDGGDGGDPYRLRLRPEGDGEAEREVMRLAARERADVDLAISTCGARRAW